jgi:uncharacterized protein YjbI with pentapeptide repeats
MQTVTAWEVIQEYNKGRRDFSNVSITIGEFAGANLSGIILRNSKIDDTTFRGASLVDADFSGSEIIFAGFNNADLTRTKFNKCIIKLSTFDGSTFDDTEMKNSNISWCGFFNANVACIDFSNSIQYKVVTDLSQITETTLIESAHELSEFMNTLDFEKRLHMRVVANRVFKDYGKDVQAIPTSASEMGKPFGNLNLYSKLLSTMLEESISAYKQKHPYKQESPYADKKDLNKSKYGAK